MVAIAPARTDDPPRDAVLDQAMRKARARLMPFLILMYLLAFLDRTNLGVAKQALEAGPGLSDAMFAFGAGVFFVGYAIFEVPSNLILHRVGARVWLARIMITWGVVAACTMFVVGDKSFVALRLLLGLAEAGFFPGVILYLTFWFPPEYRARVLGLFYFGYPLALTIGTPLSGLLLGLDGIAGLAGWQWMFLIEGLLASAVGVLTLFVLPDRPADVAWLDAPEKAALEAVLSRETASKQQEGGATFLQALRDIRLLRYVAIYFLMQVGSYGVVFYLPDQVSRVLGMKIGFEVSLVAAIPWACAILFTAVWPPLASRTNRPRLFFLVCVLMLAGGMLISAHASPLVAIVALCVAAMGIIASQAIFWTFPTDSFAGTAAAGGLATINAIGNLGGFVAPNLRAGVDRLMHSHAAGLDAIAISALLSALVGLTLPARGRRVVKAVLGGRQAGV